MNNTKLINILLKQNIPLVEFLLENISKDFSIDLGEMKEKYLTPFGKKKRKKRKSKRTNGYIEFLKDKGLNEQIKKENPNIGFAEISKKKGDMWKSMSEKDKQGYKNDAVEINKKNKEEEAE